MTPSLWKDFEAHLASDFEDWFTLKDDSWKERYRPSKTRNMEPPHHSPSRSISLQAGPDQTILTSPQLPTPNSSPPPSPESLTPAKKWLLSISDSSKELYKGQSSPSPSLSSVSPNSSFHSVTADVPLFANQYFEVLPSPKGGLGAFAIVDIPKDTIIMAEEPLFRAQPVEIYWKFEALTPEERHQYRTLSFWLGVEDQKIPAIFYTNRFETGNGLGGIFLNSSRFNHACHPYSTCTYRWDEEKKLLSFTTLMNVKAGEEITISYTNKPKTLFDNYGFHCDCPRCSKRGKSQ